MGLAPPGETVSVSLRFLFYSGAFFVASLSPFPCRDCFADIRASSSRGQTCVNTAFAVPQPSLLAIPPRADGDPGGPGTPVPRGQRQGRGWSDGGTSSAAPWFRNDISPGEQSQAPKQNQSVYVPRGGFALIDACPGLLPPTSFCSFPDNYKFSAHTHNYTSVYIYLTHRTNSQFITRYICEMCDEICLMRMRHVMDTLLIIRNCYIYSSTYCRKYFKVNLCISLVEVYPSTKFSTYI